MKPAIVVGRVVATQKTQSLKSISLLLLQPSDWQGNLLDGDCIIAADTVGAGAGEFVFYVESRDASIAVLSQPPVDAAIVGIIDGTDLQEFK